MTTNRSLLLLLTSAALALVSAASKSAASWWKYGLATAAPPRRAGLSCRCPVAMRYMRTE
jgi:hypothetical protein